MGDLNRLYAQGVTEFGARLDKARSALASLKSPHEDDRDRPYARAIKAQIHRWEVALEAWSEHEPVNCGICGNSTCLACAGQCQDPCPEVQ